MLSLCVRLTLTINTPLVGAIPWGLTPSTQLEPLRMAEEKLVALHRVNRLCFIMKPTSWSGGRDPKTCQLPPCSRCCLPQHRCRQGPRLLAESSRKSGHLGHLPRHGGDARSGGAIGDSGRRWPERSRIKIRRPRRHQVGDASVSGETTCLDSSIRHISRNVNSGVLTLRMLHLPWGTRPPPTPEVLAEYELLDDSVSPVAWLENAAVATAGGGSET